MSNIVEDPILFRETGSFEAVPSGHVQFGFRSGIPVIRKSSGEFVSLTPSEELDDEAGLFGAQTYLETQAQINNGGVIFDHTNSSDPASVVVRSSTGYAKVLRWDNTYSATAGSGSPSIDITVNIGTSSVAPYNSHLSRKFVVFATDAGGIPSPNGTLTKVSNATPTGNIKFTGSTSRQALTIFDVWTTSNSTEIKNFPNLNQLGISSAGPSTNVSVVNCPSVRILTINAPIQSLKGLDASKLTSLNISAPSAAGVEVLLPELGKANLTSLGIYNQNTKVLDISGSVALTTFSSSSSLTHCIAPPNNALTSFNYSGSVNIDFIFDILRGNGNTLTTFSFANNSPRGSLDAFDGVSFAGKSALTAIEFTNCLKSTGAIDLTGCTALTRANFFLSKFTSIVGASSLTQLQNAGVSSYALDISSNDFSANKLNELFTALPSTVRSAGIRITGNPGAATCNQSIATSKGYTIIN